MQDRSLRSQGLDRLLLAGAERLLSLHHGPDLTIIPQFQPEGFHRP
jgi:hypothetical protein